jgi:hypothetical protein
VVDECGPQSGGGVIMDKPCFPPNLPGFKNLEGFLPSKSCPPGDFFLHVFINKRFTIIIRNLARFPSDFIFEITREEYNSLRYQIGTLDRGKLSATMRRSP